MSSMLSKYCIFGGWIAVMECTQGGRCSLPYIFLNFVSFQVVEFGHHVFLSTVSVIAAVKLFV